jgi:cell division protein FtsB
MAANARRRSAGRKPARSDKPTTAARSTRKRAGRGGIRWDRLARVSLLLVLFAVLISYLGPTANYVESWRLANQTRGELQELRTDNDRLRERAKRLRDPNMIELEARRIGMARPGERAYVIRHLPKD